MAKYKRASKRKGKGSHKQAIAPKLEALDQINFNAAGLDIGDDEIYVAVPEGRDEVSVKVFKTFTADLYRLADWLTACGVETVAMESTGVYWIPTYEILEERGFELFLVNARHIKNVSGRKTDILNCQPAWRQIGGYNNFTPTACCAPPSSLPMRSAVCVIWYAIAAL